MVSYIWNIHPSFSALVADNCFLQPGTNERYVKELQIFSTSYLNAHLKRLEDKLLELIDVKIATNVIVKSKHKLLTRLESCMNLTIIPTL